MKHFVTLACLLSAPAALACTPAEVTQPSISHGDQCQLTYASPEKTVQAGPAAWVGKTIVRQFVTVGTCTGEQIAVYYDCARKRGVWLGGSYSMMGAFAPPDTAPAHGVLVLSSGPAEYFAQTQETGLDIDRIAAKAATLPWITQQGALSQSRITVEGKGFDLSCGCRLPAP